MVRRLTYLALGSLLGYGVVVAVALVRLDLQTPFDLLDLGSLPSADPQTTSTMTTYSMASMELTISQSLAQPISVERNNRLSAQFVEWAKHDRGVAITAMGEIADSATRRTIAVAIFNAFGHEASIADALAAALPPIDLTSFRIETIAELAKDDPMDAIRSALLLPTQSQRDLAFRRMVPAIVRSDPATILETLDSLGVRPNAEFRVEIVESWAERVSSPL